MSSGFPLAQIEEDTHVQKNDAPWTPADMKYLRAARQRGVTGQAMAVHLKRSRSAVLGKVHREKIALIRAPAPDVRVKVKKPRTCVARLGPRLKTRAIPAAPTVRAKPRKGVTLMNRRAGECCWPMWGEYPGVYNAFYCAAGAGDAVYCPQHTTRGVQQAVKNPAWLAPRGVKVFR